PEDSGRVKRLASSAFEAAQRGERLIEQLLMFSRRQVMRPATLNVNRVLLEFEALMRHAAGTPTEFQLRLDPALDPSRIDRAQFEAAVLNLVVNARDALRQVGRITVETRNVVVDQAYGEQHPDVIPGDYALVSVSDNGVGIDPSVLSHVFEPFFTTKEVGKGSGLGLSQVYGFAKESGGHVNIYSEIGRGTTVRLYLPKSIDSDLKLDMQPLALPGIASDGETVLVVEDDESVLTMATETLMDLGYHVLLAHDGREALRIVNGSEKVDVLFSDIVMPGGMNGVQLAIEARRIQPRIRVLLTSGYTAAALADKPGLPKEFPVLGKPYRRDQLASQLREIINGEVAQSTPQ